jgi:hypothetical protein
MTDTITDVAVDNIKKGMRVILQAKVDLAELGALGADTEAYLNEALVRLTSLVVGYDSVAGLAYVNELGNEFRPKTEAAIEKAAEQYRALKAQQA